MVFPTLRQCLGEGLADEVDAPERATYLGFVDVLDLLSGLIGALPPSVGVGAAAWRAALEEAAPRFLARRLVTLPTHGDGDVVWAARLATPLFELVTRGFLAGLSLRHGAASRRVTHRVAVFDERGFITDVLSQSDVVRFLARAPGALAAFGDASLAALRLGHARGDVACTGTRTAAVEALAHMLRTDCSALGVVEDDGALVGNLSASDLRGIVAASVMALAEPVGAVVRALHAGGADGAGTHPFFQRRLERPNHPREREREGEHAHERGRQRSPSPRAAPRQRLASPPPPPPPPVLLCDAETPFRDVVARLAASGVHRVYICDAQRRPTGVITLTDVLKAVAAMEEA